MDILLNKMNEKRKKKLLIKYIIKIIENNDEFLKQYLIKWKNNSQINNKNKDETNNIKITNRKIIYMKNKKEEQINNNKKEIEIETIATTKKNVKDNNSNLYIKHRVSGSNIKVSQISKKIINYQESETKTDYPTKIKKNIITEKTKIKYTKEEIKKFILPNPKKETTKEFSIVLNPIQRREEFDTIDLNLPSVKIPKIPEKKTKKVEIVENRLTRNRIRTNIGKSNEFFSPTYYRNKRTIDNDNNESDSINNENSIQVRKKLRFDKVSSTIDNEEVNTISLKSDTYIQNKNFGYKTYTFIPHKKIIRGKEIIGKVERNRFNEKEQGKETTNLERSGRNIRRNYQRRLFSSERKEEDELKSKSDYIKSKFETKVKQFILDKGCSRETYNDYNNFIFCEDIIYKSHDAVPEKILNISTIRMPKKKSKEIAQIEKPKEEEIIEERQSIFVTKVIKYKTRERQFGNVFKSPIKLPMTPYENELVISTLSPFSNSLRNFYKAKNRRINLFSPEQSYNERRKRREEEKNLNNLMSPSINRHYILEKKIKLNTNIPKCSIEATVDYLKDISKSCLNSNIIDNINSIPAKEISCKSKIPDKRFYPKIYKSLKKTQNLIDFHLKFLKEVPHTTFKNILPNKIYSIINDTNKKLMLLQIFYIYSHYKYNKYLIKKFYWNRWKKSIKIFSINDNEIIHIKNISGHCFSVEKIVVKEIKCGIHPNTMDFIDCLCFRVRVCLKRILLRHYLLKIIDKKKYYLFKWYKKALGKIRPIYL